MIGSQLNQYRITAALGAGAMGEVFRAFDPRLNREVAIKLLPKAFLADSDRLRRFEFESKTLAALNHPNILTIYDAGIHEGAPYLVSELLEGETLRELHSKTGAGLPIRKATDYALQMAQGLAAAHSKGIIHRDLKPENVFLTKDGRLKILDFGLAKLSEEDRRSEVGGQPDAPTVQVTQPGMVLGTPSYMSPEQVRGGPADHRSDIFSFGCVFYEMLSGTRAFRRDSAVESMNAILRDESPELIAIRPDVPGALERIVHRCLEKEREQRFQSARDLAFAIENAGIETASLARSEEPKRAAQVKALWGQWAPWGLVAVLAAAATFLSWRRTPVVDSPAVAMTGGVRKFDLTLRAAARPQVNGDLMTPAISPDGKRIAYANSEGLWVRSLDRLAPTQLAASESIVCPFWSQSSTELGYFEGRKLFRIGVAGGRPTLVCAVPEDTATGAAGGLWLNKDHLVFGTGWSGLYEVAADGGRVDSVCPTTEGESDFHNPSALPGSRGVLFSVHRTAGIDTIALWLPTGQRKVLLQIQGSVCFYPVYSPSGHVVFQRSDEAGGIWAFPFSLEKLERTGEPVRISDVGTIPSVSDDGTLVYGLFDLGEFAPRQLVWVERSGKKLETVGPPLVGLGQQQLSPDGHRIVAAAGENLSGLDIVTLDLDSGSAIPLTRNQEMEAIPFWWQEGRMIVFARSSGATAQVWAKPADGTGPETLLLEGLQGQNGSAASSMYLSRSGKYFIAARASSTGRSTFGFFDLSDPERKFTAFPAGLEHAGAWCLSGDDRLLAYQSVQTGLSEIYVVEFPSFTRRQIVSRDGGRHPMWDSTGKELFYMSHTGRSLLSVQLSGADHFGPPRKVFDLPDDIHGGFSWWPKFYEVAPGAERFLMLQNVADPASANRPPKPNLVVVQNWIQEFSSKP